MTADLGGHREAHHIIATTAAAFGVEVADLMRDCRAQEYVTPRFIAMWLVKRRTGASLPVIGRMFGDRDHSTVFSALRRVAADPALLELAAKVEADLGRTVAVYSHLAKPRKQIEGRVVEREMLVDRSEPDPSWRKRAACKGVDPALFYPAKDGEAHSEIAAAKRICAGCEVRAECREYAVAAVEVFGIFGATTPRERKVIRRQRRSERAIGGLA